MAEPKQASPPTTYKSRFPEIHSINTAAPNAPSIQPSPRTQNQIQNQTLNRERIRNLRMSTTTDVIMCICALSIVGLIIYMVVSNKFIKI